VPAAAPQIIVHTSDLGTTLLAAFGVGLALVSLAWQWRSFYLSGSRVTVLVKYGLRGIGAVVTTANPGDREQIARLQAQGFTDPVLAVQVKNAGRSPTSVVAVDLLFHHGGAIGGMQLDPPLPYRLDSESERTWYFPAEPARHYAQATETVMKTNMPHTVRGRVQLGGKSKPIVSSNRIRVL
jgi:hypothetical protein